MAIVSTALWFVGGLILIVLGTSFAVGALLPRDHVASGSAVVSKNIDDTWTMVRGTADAPKWRRGLSKIEVSQGTPEAPLRWTEHTARGALSFILVDEQRPSKLDIKIDDTNEPFGGTWTFELTPDANGTRLTITERGFVNPPPFRFLAKFVFGHATTIRNYLADISRATGGEAAAVPH